jgi:hypothetical protein
MLVLDVIIAVMPVRAFMQIQIIVDNVIVT